MEGKVTGIKPFGAFVSLPDGKNAVLAIGQMGVLRPGREDNLIAQLVGIAADGGRHGPILQKDQLDHPFGRRFGQIVAVGSNGLADLLQAGVRGKAVHLVPAEGHRLLQGDGLVGEADQGLCKLVVVP